MTDAVTYTNPPKSAELEAAEVAKALAEANKSNAEAERALAEAKVSKELAAKHRAEARRFLADAQGFEQSNSVNNLQVLKAHELYEIERGGDFYHRVYRFSSAVDSATVRKAMESLSIWHRIDPQCEIVFSINSPGGSIVDGFELFDYILFLRRHGHKVTTLATGMAASMGGVLLQAGDVRAMTPNTQLLIHEASFGAGGSTGNVKDTVERVEKLQERIVQIFAEGCARAHENNPELCTEPLTVAEIKERWERKDWWLNADECLKHGFVDEVR